MPPMREISRYGSVRLVARGKTFAMRWHDGESWRLQSCGRGVDAEVAAFKAQRLADDLAREQRLRRDAELGLVRLDVALEDGIRYGRGGARYKAGLAGYARRLTQYLTKNHPDVRFAHELRPSIVVRMIDAELDRGLAVQTVKGLLKVIYAMANRLHLLDPDHYQRMSIRHPRLTTTPKAKRYIDRDELQRLLAHCEPEAEAGVVMAGFCGLRLSECCEVKPEDIDAGRLTIATGTKTVASRRTIPAPAWIVNRLVELGQGRLYLCPRTGGVQVEEALARFIRRTIRTLGYDIQPRHLRHSFACAAIAAGVEAEHLRAYMGHAAGSVLERHYGDYSRIDTLRTLVVEKIEAHFAKPKAQVMELRG